ncbi:Protein of unknown function [Bacillus cereus]|nr:Protein of unknown function [Bacillus cereus]SCN32353.1 Protein of unknown function [Bacillus wiedmannii]SCN43507.1 Protein of unknown function [Bacillus cereus]
MGDEQNLID